MVTATVRTVVHRRRPPLCTSQPTAGRGAASLRVSVEFPHRCSSFLVTMTPRGRCHRPGDVRASTARRQGCLGPAGRPPAWRPVLPLRRVFHRTPIGGVLADKKGLQGRLNLLPKNRPLLIGLHGLKRVPHADGKTPIRSLHVLGQPPPPQALALLYLPRSPDRPAHTPANSRPCFPRLSASSSVVLL